MTSEKLNDQGPFFINSSDLEIVPLEFVSAKLGKASPG
jgi:hypothetical protein